MGSFQNYFHRPFPSADQSPDGLLLRAAARKVGLQLAATVAVVVLIVSVLALTLTRLNRGDRRDPRGSVPDILFDDGLFWAGAIGVLIAGAVGWFAAGRAVKPLGEALQLQRRFVADAGHELRTPLTVLHTRAQLLSRKIASDHPGRAITDQLLADSRVLGEVVDDLLTSAQLGVDPAKAEPVDLAGVAAEVTTSMQIVADQVGVTLHTQAESVLVSGSRSALRRAILALVDNGIAHTPPGGSVWVACAGQRDQAVLTVTDDGEGLDPADAQRLMERFARGSAIGGESARPAGTGTRRFGLGLALVRQIVDAHGGRLTVEGEKGVGARVTIYLPQRSQVPVTSR